MNSSRIPTLIWLVAIAGAISLSFRLHSRPENLELIARFRTNDWVGAKDHLVDQSAVASAVTKDDLNRLRDELLAKQDQLRNEISKTPAPNRSRGNARH